jgi:hypothetical protein
VSSYATTKWVSEQLRKHAKKLRLLRSQMVLGGGLRIVRGRINTASPGSILVGEGFTITRNGVGDLTVTFDPPFADEPAVNVTKGGGSVGDVSASSVGASSFQALIANAAGAAVDSNFSFTAIGTA